MPGNTALLKLNFSAASRFARIMPPLGPRSVLWVVVVTTCAYGIGLSWKPAATRAGDVGHVHHQVRARLVRDLPEPLKVDLPGVGAGPRDEELRALAQERIRRTSS